MGVCEGATEARDKSTEKEVDNIIHAESLDTALVIFRDDSLFDKSLKEETTLMVDEGAASITVALGDKWGLSTEEEDEAGAVYRCGVAVIGAEAWCKSEVLGYNIEIKDEEEEFILSVVLSADTFKTEEELNTSDLCKAYTEEDAALLSLVIVEFLTVKLETLSKM